MPTRGETTLAGWPRGINNLAKDTALPDGFLRDAVNVDLDDAGKPRRRSGRTKVIEGVRAHSLYTAACGLVYVEGSELRRVNPDHTVEALGDLARWERVSYDTVNDETFLTNGYETWRLSAAGELSLNGVPSPIGNPLVSFDPEVGGLIPGRYLITLTYLSADGEESGAGLTLEVTTSQVGALVLRSIPENDTLAAVRVYCTEPDGTVLREVAELPMGTESYTLGTVDQGRVLETQFMTRLPPGQIIRYFQGRMFVASGSTLWYSQALRYGLCRRADDFFSFPGEITVVQPVLDGLFVVADKTYFLRGTDPKQMAQVVVADGGGVPGTGQELPGDVFDDQLTHPVAYWYTRSGAVLGMPGGIIRQLMDDNIALPSYDEGATLLREQNGLRHAVTALRGSGTQSAFALGDSIDVTVRRNGIVI